MTSNHCSQYSHHPMRLAVGECFILHNCMPVCYWQNCVEYFCLFVHKSGIAIWWVFARQSLYACVCMCVRDGDCRTDQLRKMQNSVDCVCVAWCYVGVSDFLFFLTTLDSLLAAAS